MRYCKCGKAGGCYLDSSAAKVTEGAVSIGIGSGEFYAAVQTLFAYGNKLSREQWQEKGQFLAWVRPNCMPGNPHTEIVPNVRK